MQWLGNPYRLAIGIDHAQYQVVLALAQGA